MTERVTTYLTIDPRDPLVARDGRPFGVGSGRRMKSLDWPYPSVAAGSFRTALGKALGGDFAALLADLKAVEFAGVFPVVDGTLFLPAAADLAVTRDGTCHALRPIPAGNGDGATDLNPGLSPVCLPLAATGKLDDDLVPAWWSSARFGSWLAASAAAPAGFLTDRNPGPEPFLGAPPHDERTHLEVDPKTFAACDGLLFSSTGLAVDLAGERSRSSVRLAALAARVKAPTGFVPAGFDVVHPVGGERRLARIRAAGPAVATLWAPPDSVTAALAAARADRGLGIRMVLATPAVFSGGWRPGWVDAATLKGAPAAAAAQGLTLKLVGVCNRRWRALSGWSYEEQGPKPVRRLVPAGGVYFFEQLAGDPTVLADHWLQPVGDGHWPEPVGETLSADGFGLATWGTWSWGDV